MAGLLSCRLCLRMDIPSPLINQHRSINSTRQIAEILRFVGYRQMTICISVLPLISTSLFCPLGYISHPQSPPTLGCLRRLSILMLVFIFLLLSSVAMYVSSIFSSAFSFLHPVCPSLKTVYVFRCFFVHLFSLSPHLLSV